MTKTIGFYAILFLAAQVAARPLSRREVPQEHSHEKFLTAVGASLNLNNPAKIVDPVFGLLGNKVRFCPLLLLLKGNILKIQHRQQHKAQALLRISIVFSKLQPTRLLPMPKQPGM